MGKVITDEDIKLNIIINGNDAQKELLDLEKSTRKLSEENKALLLRKKLLQKQGKEETEEYKKLTATIKENSKAINANKARMIELQREIGITGLTMKQLGDRANLLKMKLRNAIPNGEAYKKYKKELEEVKNRISELSSEAEGAGVSIGSIADGFNRYAALGASIIAMFTGVVLSLQKAIDFNAKLSDAQSDVMKTTGMTKTEVDELTKSFGALVSRTKRIELLGIAEVGGRLGIAKREIQDFVVVMNKAAVALGDSFEGGPEEVADKLGKIKNLYAEIKNMGVETAFNAVGSAINDLGADGTATEQNLAAFTTRVGALPGKLKPSIAQALGLGAAFEESGLKAEIAGNNYGKVISIASRDFPQFAKVMGVSEGKIKDLLNTDPTEFFLQFANSLKGLSLTELSQVLDYLKLNDNEVKMVLGAASENVALFREKIDLANKSLNDGTSLTEEYNIKNNNLAATLEKIGKKITAAFSSETIVNKLAEAAEWFGRVVGATEDLDGSGQKWRNTLAFLAKAIAVVTAAIITNVTWQKLVVLWTGRSTQGTVLYNLAVRARAFAEGISMIATQAYAATTMLLTGNIRGATQALRVMTATMMTTPWGLFLSLISAVGVAYWAFSESANNATAVQKTLSGVHLEATKNIAAQKKEVELLEKIVKDENVAEETRIKALEKLNQLIPDHIGVLTLENIKLMEGTDILKKYTDELYRNARAKAAQTKFEELARQKLDVENKKGRDFREDKWYSSKWDGNQKIQQFKDRSEIEKYVLETFGNEIGKRTDKNTGATLVNKQKFNELVEKFMKESYLDEKEAALSEIEAQMKALEGDLMTAAIDDLNSSEAKPNTWVPGTDEGKKKKKYDDSYLEAERRAREELFQAYLKSEEDKINLMVDGYEKQLALEKLNHTRKIHDLEMTNESINILMEKLNVDLLQAQKDGDTKKVTSIRNQQRLLLARQKDINDQICYEEELTKLRIGTIQEKAANEHLEKEKADYEQQKILRATKFNEELATLGNNERAKIELRKQFAEEELKNEEEYLRVLIDRLNSIAGKGKFTNFDLSLLSPAQVEEFTREAEKVGLTLAELIAKKNQLNGSGDVKENLKSLGLGGAGTDILGFTPENWEQFYANLQEGKHGINSMLFAVQALTNLWSKYSEFVSANENAQLKKFEKTSDAKKNKLKRQLDAGYISQNQYNKAIETIDRELEMKKANLEYKQAKRQRTINIANAIGGTALAVINALQTQPFFPLGLAMAGIAGVMGALQVATIMKTPLPSKGYEKGLYPDYVDVQREQDGKLFRPKYGGKLKSGLVSKNTLMVAEGNKPEMVIDNKAWTKISPEVQQALIREIQGVKGFENGYYKDGLLYSGVTPDKKPEDNPPQDTGVMMQLLIKVVAENTEAINDLKSRPLEAVVDPRKLNNIKELKDGFKVYEDLKTKQKK
ncbi:phage tail tape measure protein [Flavobacterium sp. PLA-1-15]|uniref:phage tail tape measure protein n=1 Tax=Flavobacterium sp. PLA-1-15 TaxID=3380533 RepID=UPI003B7A715D